jgi:anti-anti-sigma regulatory factor
MDFYFSPVPNGFKDSILNVAPDLLPKGSIKIESVTINGEQYSDFDADNLTVKLPASDTRMKVKVTIAPTAGLEHFSAKTDIVDGKGYLTLNGELDSRGIIPLRQELQKVLQCDSLTIDVSNLKLLSTEGARALIFAKQKMNIDEDVIIKGASDQVKEVLLRDEFAEELIVE